MTYGSCVLGSLLLSKGRGAGITGAAGGQEGKRVAREGQPRSDMPVSDHSSCSPILVLPQKCSIGLSPT